jgi:hypothetical protein
MGIVDISPIETYSCKREKWMRLNGKYNQIKKNNESEWDECLSNKKFVITTVRWEEFILYSSGSMNEEKLTNNLFFDACWDEKIYMKLLFISYREMNSCFFFIFL